MRFFYALLFIALSGCSGSNPRMASERSNDAAIPSEAGPPEAVIAGAPDKLPTDPAILSGTLPNGLRYMVRENARPEKRAELRLVLNAGSILEDDDQLGLAHFVEHMAFNGTENFEKQALVEYLESIGMRFGPDINAYTSFDETVYMLQLPTDSTEILDTGLQILRDWAGRVTFDPQEIEKERGVVIEEWRRSRGAAARIQDRQLPVMLQASRYADRLPIGDPDLLASFEHEVLVRFYSDWYRPDLMTVIAVGDFSAVELENKLVDLFSDVPAQNRERERTVYPVPPHENVLYTIESDPEASSAQVSVLYKHQPWAQGTRRSYRDRLRSSLYSSMFNQRLSELTQSADPPFIVAGSSDGALVRTRAAYRLSALVKDGAYLRALTTVLEEARRVRLHGFTESELDRAKTNLLRGREIAFNERDKTNSSVFASELVRHVLTSEAIPGIEFEFELTKELLPGIRAQEVNQLLVSLMTESNQVISISGPENDSQPLPTVDEVRAVFEEVRGTDLAAYVDDVDDEPLLEAIPSPGSIVEESEIDGLGVTQLKLSNGIRVVLKPTDFKNDQIVMRASSPGGLSLVDDAAYSSALFALQLIGGSGVGSYDPIELQKKLTGKAVQVSPSVSSLSEGYSGTASPQDLESMFQLIYLYGTAPRADSVVYASYMTRISSFLANMKANPQTAFGDTLSTTLAQNHFRARPLSQEILDDVSLAESLAFYEDRFSDFSDFTFYFVGAFDIPTIKPFITTYLGSLPSSNREESWRDEGIRAPDGVVKKTVVRGIEPQSQVSIVFAGDAAWSLPERRRLGFLGDVLRIRLREVLREDLGGTYSVSVNSSMNDRPYESYRISISFGCAPDRVDELISEVFREIGALKSVPPDEVYLQNAKEAALRNFEVGIKENGYWMGLLQFYLERDLDATAILSGPAAWMDSITVSDIQSSAQKYLPDNRFVQVTLVPENEQ